MTLPKSKNKEMIKVKKVRLKLRFKTTTRIKNLLLTKVKNDQVKTVSFIDYANYFTDLFSSEILAVLLSTNSKLDKVFD